MLTNYIMFLFFRIILVLLFYVLTDFILGLTKSRDKKDIFVNIMLHVLEKN